MSREERHARFQAVVARPVGDADGLGLAGSWPAMTPNERHARFLAVVQRALSKPVSELPYRAPVKTRFHYQTGRTTPDPRQRRGKPGRLSGQTSMKSGDLTAMSNLRSSPTRTAPARREVTSVSDDDPGILEYHRLADGRTTVEFNDASLP